MIHIAFLNQYFLVQKEVIGALKRMPGVRVFIIDIADFPGSQQAQKVCKVLDDNDCRVVVTINDWGFDAEGLLAGHLQRKSIVHLNWCVDDPFFMELFHNRPLNPMPNRIDFVSNRAYVADMRNRGLSTHFLPLAADPELFFPLPGNEKKIRDACFVGNSYRKQIDDLCGQYGPFMESLVPFMGETLRRYETNVALDIEAKVLQKLSTMDLPESLTPPKAVFIVKHFISYLFRKKFVCGIARRYPDFMVFGDEQWLCDLPKERVGRGVGYYANLNETYGATKINIDINRVVITEGFTQRVFDCLSGGNFVLTNKKPIVDEFFRTSGAGREAVVFDNATQCLELIDYFLKHDEERTAIALRGRQRVLSQHTYDHRIGSMFKVAADYLGTRRGL